MNEFDVGVVALSLYLYLELTEKKNRRKENSKGRIWSRGWLTRRQIYTHENLLNDITLTEPKDFGNCLRFGSETFDELNKTKQFDDVQEYRILLMIRW